MRIRLGMLDQDITEHWLSKLSKNQSSIQKWKLPIINEWKKWKLVFCLCRKKTRLKLKEFLCLKNTHTHTHTHTLIERSSGNVPLKSRTPMVWKEETLGVSLLPSHALSGSVLNFRPKTLWSFFRGHSAIHKCSRHWLLSKM